MGADVALWIIAGVVLVVFLKWAASMLILMFLGILFAYTLAPLVNRLDLTGIPRVISATLVMSALIAGTGWIAVSLGDEVESVIDQLPEKAGRLRAKLSEVNARGTGSLKKLREAANELDRAATEAAAAAHGTSKRAEREPVSTPVSNRLRQWIGDNASIMLNGIVDSAIVILLAYSLLAAGPLFRQKLVSLVGPGLAAKKEAIRTLDEIQRQMQAYLLSLTVANILIGLTVWGTFAALGVNNAGVWGLMAALLHFIPYAGPFLLALLSAVSLFLQSGSYAQAFGVAVVALAINGAIGMGIVTWMQARVYRVSAFSVFFSLLFFGWLWGAWGVVLAAPLLGIIKVTVDHIPSLKRIGAVLEP